MRVYGSYRRKTSRWCGQSGMSVCPCSHVSQTVTTLSVAVLNVACPKWKVDPSCNVAALRFDWFRNYGDSWCQHLQLPELSTLVVGWDRHSGESDIVFIHVLCGFCLLFGMSVKLCRSHWGRNVDWGCLRIGCWGIYLGLRGTRWQGNGENYIMRSLVICITHQISWCMQSPFCLV
jgi:hypothetical protein